MDRSLKYTNGAQQEIATSSLTIPAATIFSAKRESCPFDGCGRDLALLDLSAPTVFHWQLNGRNDFRLGCGSFAGANNDNNTSDKSRARFPLPRHTKFANRAFSPHAPLCNCSCRLSETIPGVSWVNDWTTQATLFALNVSYRAAGLLTRFTCSGWPFSTAANDRRTEDGANEPEREGLLSFTYNANLSASL